MKEDEIHRAILAIYSRLSTIDGKVTLVARADRDRILDALREVVTKSPRLGQIYLLLDGKRNQRQIGEALEGIGVMVSEATISRDMSDLAGEHGVADLVKSGNDRVYRKNREMEQTLNLSKNMRKWLKEAGESIPTSKQTRKKS